jgi:hypothetical protein
MIIWDMNWHKSRLVEVDLQASDGGERVKQFFCTENLVLVRAQEEESVVGVLYHWAR